MEQLKVKVQFNAAAINEALAKAIESNILCLTCLAKIETMTEMAQSDICSPCQQVIQVLLGEIMERQLQHALDQSGLPANGVRIGIPD